MLLNAYFINVYFHKLPAHGAAFVASSSVQFSFVFIFIVGVATVTVVWPDAITNAMDGYYSSTCPDGSNCRLYAQWEIEILGDLKKKKKKTD